MNNFEFVNVFKICLKDLEIFWEIPVKYHMLDGNLRGRKG